MELVERKPRTEGWDATDELKERGPDSMRAIIEAAKPFNSQETPPPKPESIPPFPTEALIGPMQALVEEGARALQCSKDLIGIPLVVAAGSAIGNARELFLKRGWTEHAGLFAAALASPGQTKTGAFQLAKHPVDEREKELRCIYDVRKTQYEIDEASWERNKTRLRPERPHLDRMTIVDATTEAIASLFRHAPRGLLLCRDELSGWVQSLNAYKKMGADRQFFMSTWSKQSIRVDRKMDDEPIAIDGPFLAITGTIQPDTVRSLLHEESWDDGFLDRFLLAYPEYHQKSSWTEDVVSEETEGAVAEVFKRLYSLQPDDQGEPVTIRLDGPAKELWVKWYNRIQDEARKVPENLRGIWSKMPRQPY